MTDPSNDNSEHDPSSDRRCTAHRSDGDPCRRWAVAGGTVCPSHGGRAPQVRAAAARRLARVRIDAELGELLAELEVDAADRGPVAVLLDAVNRCAAMVQVLGALVGGLRADQLDDSAYVALYGTWLDRAARAARLALEAGIEERAIRLAERQGQLIAELLARVFDDPDLGLDVEQRHTARSIAVRHLVALPGGAS